MASTPSTSPTASDAPDALRATPNAVAGLRALADIAWMARRQASRPANADQSAAFNEANWRLHNLARAERINLGNPDRMANGEYNEDLGRIVETPSFFADGAPTNFTPAAERAAELKDMDRSEAVQWIVSIMHPLAHRYADGSSTYAPGMFNDATRLLRNTGYDLSTTEALGMSVWVTDGMGDGFLRLSATEIAERDAARAVTA